MNSVLILNNIELKIKIKYFSPLIIPASKLAWFKAHVKDNYAELTIF